MYVAVLKAVDGALYECDYGTYHVAPAYAVAVDSRLVRVFFPAPHLADEEDDGVVVRMLGELLERDA